MKKFTAWVRDYFAFSRTEARGSVVLLLCTGLLISAAAWFNQHWATAPPVPAEDWHTLDSLVAVLDSISVAPTTEEAQVFLFNPNEADSAMLTQLGLKPYIAQRVLRYRAKGGTFYQRSDFRKIYGLPEKTYRRLYDYIQLPEQRTPTQRKRKARPSLAARTTKSSSGAKKSIRLDINRADTAQLRQLSGIGRKLSARIVKFREKLGGFHRIEQLQQVYHMTDQGWGSLQQSAYVIPENSVQRLNINRCDVETLAQHPYISWDIARALVNHRRDYGEYRTLDDLKEVYLITPKLFEKIAPYLEI